MERRRCCAGRCPLPPPQGQLPSRSQTPSAGSHHAARPAVPQKTWGNSRGSRSSWAGCEPEEGEQGQRARNSGRCKKARLRCSVRARRSGGIRNSGSGSGTMLHRRCGEANSGSSGGSFPPTKDRPAPRQPGGGGRPGHLRLMPAVFTRHSKCSASRPGCHDLVGRGMPECSARSGQSCEIGLAPAESQPPASHAAPGQPPRRVGPESSPGSGQKTAGFQFRNIPVWRITASTNRPAWRRPLAPRKPAPLSVRRAGAG